MRLVFALLFGALALQDHAAGYYVRLQALNANSGLRAGGERVASFITEENALFLKPYDTTSSQQARQEFEKMDDEESNLFFLYPK